MSLDRSAANPGSIALTPRTVASGTSSPPLDSAVDEGLSGSPLPPRRRRLLWTLVALLVLLLLAITPPLLNVNRLRRRIAASMSASIGRPVRLDGVSLHLLPMPGFTLTNLVVSEDPAFGYEPTIRAGEVEATLRPSSLWRRQVEFSTIRFVEPSLNLVRNAQGRWNLQSLLVHAAQVDTAPTAQSKAGPQPRFPYIEATGARVNLKLGQEKQPFSLTDADFALWLPSSQQWRVRLKAKPARTDSNIADPGTMRLEGSLERAATMALVPVDLVASWRDAPLGEASRLLTGQDAGWRGTLDLDATLSGELGAAKLATSVHVNDLRRADFVPVTSLDLNLDCNGTLETTAAVIHDPECVLHSPRVDAIADTIDLTSRATSGVRIGSPGVPENWLLNWARLFSQRVPAGASGIGKVTGSVASVPGVGSATVAWQGQVHGDLAAAFPGFPPGAAGTPGQAPKPSQFTITSGPGGAVLAPVNLAGAGDTPPLWLSGEADRKGYRLNLQGTATAQQIHALRAMFPPLTDGLEPALLSPAEPRDKALKVDVACTRAWGAAQTCAPATPTPAKKSHPRRARGAGSR